MPTLQSEKQVKGGLYEEIEDLSKELEEMNT